MRKTKYESNESHSTLSLPYAENGQREKSYFVFLLYSIISTTHIVLVAQKNL